MKQEYKGRLSEDQCDGYIYLEVNGVDCSLEYLLEMMYGKTRGVNKKVKITIEEDN